jgi:putative DNA primase/helicase
LEAIAQGGVAMMHATLPPAGYANKKEAARFLKALDPEATFFTFQTFDDDKERKNAELTLIIHGTVDEFYDELARLNDQGAGVFVTVNETDGRGRTADNIVRVRALFEDLDGSPIEPILTDAEMPQPQIVVESSPGRWHAYKLITCIEKEDFSRLQKTLSERYNSDKKVHDLPRVMRLPGFVHRKGEPFLTRIVSISETAPYPAAIFLEKFPRPEPQQPRSGTPDRHR